MQQNQEASPDRVSGTVKWFDAKKGMGFVLNAAGEQFFIHYSHINSPGFKTLLETDKVSFLPVKTEKGLAAHFLSIENP